MPRKRRFFKALSVFTGTFFLLMFLLTNVLFFVPRPWNPPPQDVSRKPVSITVARYLYHTGVFLPVQTPEQDWSKVFPCLAGKQFVEIGWGDRDFYMSGAITPKLALQALFASKASVVNVNGFDTSPATDSLFPTEPFEQRTFRLSEENYHLLTAWILTSVKFSEGKAVFIRGGFWGASSAFYEANGAQTGAYSIVNNCNVWNSKAFEAANLAVPLWAGIPQPLMMMLPKQ